MLLLVVEGLLRCHFVQDQGKFPEEFELVLEMWCQSIVNGFHIYLRELIRRRSAERTQSLSFQFLEINVVPTILG